MIKLSHATQRGDDYVFMWFTTPGALKYWR
jgi:hypothetical protein